MRQVLTEALKLLGFTTPFIYAVVTYAFFAFLDKNASGPAKAAISNWIKRSPIQLEQVGAAILELFNRLYGRHLFTSRTFRRSAFISVTILLLSYVARVLIEWKDSTPTSDQGQQA